MVANSEHEEYSDIFVFECMGLGELGLETSFLLDALLSMISSKHSQVDYRKIRIQKFELIQTQNKTGESIL